MDKPLVVVNFKTYASATGDAALAILSAMDAHKDGPARLIAAVTAFDLRTSTHHAQGTEIWTQHLDPVGQGGFTGWLEPQHAIAYGATGSLINHAEHKVELEHVRELMSKLPAGFDLCACAADVEEARALALLNPTYIAVEPPELIGGDISVTTADPAVVSETVAIVKDMNPHVRVLCGAGVKNGKDVAKAIELGAQGVLLASGVTKAEDVHAVIADLLSEL